VRSYIAALWIGIIERGDQSWDGPLCTGLPQALGGLPDEVLFGCVEEVVQKDVDAIEESAIEQGGRGATPNGAPGSRGFDQAIERVLQRQTALL